ncbi:MAG TPA: histidine kinase, partial [Pseudomonas sp.]|nr:histidine kinase [Pseudomonas sp.]
AERLGAGDVPRSRAQIEAYLKRTSPQLRSDERALEILQILRTAPAPSPLLRPFGTLMLHAGVELLPEWAQEMLGLTLSESRRQLIRAGVRSTAPVVRWAVRSGSVHRARRRMGLPPR